MKLKIGITLGKLHGHKIKLLAIFRPHAHENSGLPDAGASQLIPLTEQEDRLQSQPGTVRLDAFTHCLVAKCGPEVTCDFYISINRAWLMISHSTKL